jgi:hypothetical protein
MDDPNDPNSPENLSWNWGAPPKWRPFSGQQSWLRPGGLRVPRPAGPPPKQSKAEREEEMRAKARAARLHEAGLTKVWAIAMSVVLAAVVVMLVLALVAHH